MPSFLYTAASEQQTAALGAALADALPDGSVVGLYGTLGAGKTRLVQALAEACEVPRRAVTSPTFVLMQPYEGRRTLYHFDAYRIASDEEFLDLGPDEYFERPGLVLIEWADRVQNCLPREHLEVYIEVVGAESRRIEVRAVGARYAPTIARLEAWRTATTPHGPM